MGTQRLPQGSLSKRPKRFVLSFDDLRLSVRATCPLLLPKGRCTAWGGVGFPTFCPRPARRVEGVVLGAAGAMHYSLTHERRVASARFWGHRDRMMSGSTTPSIHNQRFIGMHQHYWTQRYRLSRSLSDNVGTLQPFILDAQCWREPHFRPGTGHPAPHSKQDLPSLPCCYGLRPHHIQLAFPIHDRASHLGSANSCVYQNLTVTGLRSRPHRLQGGYLGL